MAEEKYEVFGNFKGENVKEEVMAYSPEQAKFKAGISTGHTGSEFREFKKKVRVRRK